VQLVLFESYAIAQAVSRLHFTTKTRFRPHPSPCEICGGQSGNGRDFTPSTSPFRIITICSYYYLKFISISILWVPIVRGSVSSKPMRCSQGHICVGYRIQVKLLSALHKTANKRKDRPTFCASKDSVILQERSQFQRQTSKS